jgi:hypothetical protein
MMNLYTFGFNPPSTLHAPNPIPDTSNTPTLILRAPAIKIIWSSWCDVIYAHLNPSDIWTVAYKGTSLTSEQKTHIEKCQGIQDALTEHETMTAVQFFGGKMHDGVRGYVLSNSADSEIVIFATSSEEEKGIALVQAYVVSGRQKVVGIQMESSGGVLVSVVDEGSSGEGGILRFDSMEELRDGIEALVVSDAAARRIATFAPKQWCTNATTATALGGDGQVYTATRDPRYAKCLARAYTGSAEFEAVPYLSETHVRSISSGGYMSAAVSVEGELFLWGQASPGVASQLSVLKEAESPRDNVKEMAGTRVTIEDDQDEMVKCLSVFIAGEEACVYDVAIGHGHVLVAAEVQQSGGNIRRAVLGAGANKKGQLGLPSKAEFIENFEEIPEFKGAKIKQMVATAWSTLVVTLKD